MHPILYAILGVVIILVLGPVSTLSASSICTTSTVEDWKHASFPRTKVDFAYISTSSHTSPRLSLLLYQTSC